MKEKLSVYKKKTITLDTLSSFTNHLGSYDEFYQQTIQLMEKGILSPIAKAGNNGLAKALPNKFRINKIAMQEEKIQCINKKILTTNTKISLESYFSMPFDVFKKDEVWIDLINQYIDEKGMPKSMCIPELSYALVGDEKWIELGEGRRVLNNIGLWDQLEILLEPDPIAFTINKANSNQIRHKHLIVENKTPFIHLSNAIESSQYNTVIYGQGWKIVSGIRMFRKQYPFGEHHEFYYFGDVDSEGIAIYEQLKHKDQVYPAVEFYRQLINKPWSEGKAYQKLDRDNISEFIREMNHLLAKTDAEDRANYILKMIESGYYQPQEILTSQELVDSNFIPMEGNK